MLYDLINSTTPSDHSKYSRRNNSQPYNRPPSLLDLLIRNRSAHIPSQMSKSIEAVEGERQRNKVLCRKLERDRPSRKSGRHARALEV